MTDFQPLRWLKSPHLQTIGAAVPLFTQARPRLVRSSEEDLRFPVAHRPGGLVSGNLHARAWWGEGRGPAVVILHGIAGSKDSHCVVRAATAFHEAGYHVVRLDMRGAGDSVAEAPSLYHAGLTTDLDLVVRELAAHPRVSCVTILGYSGGGGQALKLAGEWGSNVPGGVVAVASVSAPLDYTRVAARMDTLGCLPYRFHVLRTLVECARQFSDRYPERSHFQPRDLGSIRRFRTYDERIIVPMHGFRDVDRYYREASAGPWLGRVEVPTIILHAEDDPMVPMDTVRPWLADASSVVTSRFSREGGHIGWLAGLDEASWTKSWATASALSFFAPHLRNDPVSVTVPPSMIPPPLASQPPLPLVGQSLRDLLAEAAN